VKHYGLFGWALLLALLVCAASSAGAPAPTNAPSTNATSYRAIPLPEVTTQAESASATLHAIDSDLAADPIVNTVEHDLPVISREIGARLDEHSRLLASNPSLESLRRLVSEWRDLQSELARWKRDLIKRASQLDSALQRLTQLEQSWKVTLDSAQKAKAPAETIDRIQGLANDIQHTRDAVQQRQALVLSLENRIADENEWIGEALDAIGQAREQVLNHLFERDSPPIWSSEMTSPNLQDLSREARESFASQFTALGAYAQRKRSRFVGHAVLFVALLAFFLWAGRRPWVRQAGDPALERAALLFQVPISNSILLSLLLSFWLYPQAPRLLWAFIGAGLLIPTTFILRKLIEPRLFPILNALVALYLVDQCRAILASQAVLSRWLFLLEMLGGISFALWLLWSARLAAVPKSGRVRLWKVIRFASWVALLIFSAALISGALGCMNLAKFIGNTFLSSAYLALILYAVVRVADRLVLLALSVRPFSRLKLINRHRALVQHWIRRVLVFAASVLWALFVLESLSLRAPLFRALQNTLTTTIGVRNFKLSLADVLLFVLTIWASFIVSRLIRFALDEEVYPRVQLAAGVHYSISRMLHYLILVIGFLFGLAFLGVNMTHVTILAGAFSVGVGLGLQNIVNNFISGLILLFERPVKVGDLIQFENTPEGIVRRIGIRASVIRTTAGSEIIIPNGRFISDQVINWTFSNRQRRIDVPVAVAAGADTHHAIEIMERTASSIPAIAREPAPHALVVSSAGGTLNLELHAWTDHFDDLPQIRSDLTVAVNAALAAANIPLH